MSTTRYHKTMIEALQEVDEIATHMNEVSPPGWEGSVKAMKKHSDIDNPWALAWHMKNRGNKPHYKDQDGRPEKKAKYKNEEVDTDGIVQLDEGNIDELSTDLLGRYKTKAAAQSSAAAKSGDHEKSHKRFKGITKATSKQFDNDAKAYDKRHEESEMDEKLTPDQRRKREGMRQTRSGEGKSGRKSGTMMPARGDFSKTYDRFKQFKKNIGPQGTPAGIAGHKAQRGVKKVRGAKEEVEMDEGGAYGGGLKDAAKKVKDAEKRLGITPDKVTTTKSGVRKTTYKGKVDMGSVKKEDMDFKVKLKGLPAFYVPGKSAAAIKLMLRRQVKRPEDIEGVDRVTTAAKRKDFRLRGQGKSVEPEKDGE